MDIDRTLHVHKTDLSVLLNMLLGRLQVYSSCACVKSSNNASSVSIDNCATGSCNSTMYIFLFMILLSAFTVSGSTVPALTVVLRYVPLRFYLYQVLVYSIRNRNAQ